ncbi:hypothetical protein WN943_012333 [Citrus x changshan-huyou]
MGRAPCCDKSGLKKGPWTPEEDQKLIDYIQKHGYGNWRTLPKNAGLQRCGKSCRLRWTNYLRPDIKRGRFSFEEEETIIQLHSILGNNSSQMNISRLVGAQTLVNPELLRLATSLMSTHHHRENQNQIQKFIYQNFQENQYQQLVQPDSHQLQIPLEACCSLTPPPPCVSHSNDQAQLMNSNVEQFPTNFTNFSNQNCQQSEWQSNGMPSNLTEDYVPIPPSYSYYGSDQTVMDPSSETSNFHSNNSNQSFNFASVLSTPSSGSTPLNSNSTYISTEDERESNCSNMLKFEIPDILDVNEFM